MDKSYEFSLALHLYSPCASEFLMFFYLVLTQGDFRTEFIFIHRIRLFLPICYVLLALMLFTGPLLLAIRQFRTHLNLWLITFSWVFIFASAIFHFIQFKRARRLGRYITFGRISFMVLFYELVLLVLPFLVGEYL